MARLYSQALKEIEGLTLPPPDPPHKKSVFHRYVIRTPKRDQLMAYLKERGIGTGIYYPVPLHLQKAWAREGYPRGAFPVSERLCREGLAIPLFPEMRDQEIHEVIEALQGFFGGTP